MMTYPLRVAERRRETDDAVSLSLEIAPGLATAFGYRAGQFVTIENDLCGETLRRQCSLGSAPSLDAHSRITVKRTPGDRMSTWLVEEVGIGDLLKVAPPRGRLHARAVQLRHHALLAAGSGIAPLVAIARDALAAGAGHRVTLAYGNRRADGIILREQVDALTAGGARVERVLSRADDNWSGPQGQVAPAYLADRWGAWCHDDDPPVSAFLCGPEAFMAAAEEFLPGTGRRPRRHPRRTVRGETWKRRRRRSREVPDRPGGRGPLAGRAVHAAGRRRGRRRRP